MYYSIPRFTREFEVTPYMCIFPKPPNVVELSFSLMHSTNAKYSLFQVLFKA
jgi:hypothetical protein